MKSQQIRERIQRVNEGMPDFVKFDPVEILDNMQISIHPMVSRWDPARLPVNVLNLLFIHCNLRHTEFQLERSLVKRNKTSTRSLIPLARELLRLVLAALSRRDYLRDFQIDIVCLVSTSALLFQIVIADPDD